MNLKNKKVRWMSVVIPMAICLMIAGYGCSKNGDVPTQEDKTAVVDEKPVIYVYGEEDGQNVDITLETDNEITCEYPQRPDGVNTWYVKADKDGSLKYYPTKEDQEGDAPLEGQNDEFSYIFWEGKGDASYDFSKGYCVAGKDTVSFLENKLAELGLNGREANDFIVYWLPRMQNNKYNIISFQKDAYNKKYQLSTVPASKVLRVFMAFKSADKETEIPEQDLSAIRGSFNRDGLTVVEWGGAEVKK